MHIMAIKTKLTFPSSTLIRRINQATTTNSRAKGQGGKIMKSFTAVCLPS